ncbi:Hypothetical predicted protein [Scomber scombrus]|uniref:Uncharacterized protein n=1 Tax=Scomber scombrus TaxID=13677 RepID=A0AAV1NY04_SCOSC
MQRRAHTADRTRLHPHHEGKNASSSSSPSGLKEKPFFESLFINNHHNGMQRVIRMHCRMCNHTIQRAKKCAQLAKKMHPPPARGHEDDTRVLGIDSSEDIGPALKGKKKPCVKMNHRTGLGYHHHLASEVGNITMKVMTKPIP